MEKRTFYFAPVVPVIVVVRRVNTVGMPEADVIRTRANLGVNDGCQSCAPKLKLLQALH